MSNKSNEGNNNIMIIEENSNRLVTNEIELANMLNNHYVNIVEKSSGEKPISIDLQTAEDNYDVIRNIISNFKDHESIVKIMENCPSSQISFQFQELSSADVKKLFSEVNFNASAGEDGISPKLSKIAGKYLVESLTHAINSSIRKSYFPNRAKLASVTPLDKGSKNKTTMGNFRPVSVLNFFSKFYEKAMKNQLMTYFENKVSPFLSAYRKNYSTQHVLLRLLEQWKEKLDLGYTVGAVLMDLSKAFDCVPHDLIIAKLHAYGLGMTALEFILSYLTNRYQRTKVNTTFSSFEKIVSGVPQGSILGPVLFIHQLTLHCWKHTEMAGKDWRFDTKQR